MEKKTLVIGVIGADVHAIGNKILYHCFVEAGFNVINLGVMVSQEEYVEAAIESNADAILVSSLYGHGEIDCRGLRERCEEWGLRKLPKSISRMGAKKYTIICGGKYSSRETTF
ncbi:methylaspartate mutase subunit S [Terrisporobacter sp.]|uniref:methylaspartate mutase subunit S n=2 Tax=Terrisporobacter TaxID=1505652 RepID=UPI002F428833